MAEDLQGKWHERPVVTDSSGWSGAAPGSLGSRDRSGQRLPSPAPHTREAPRALCTTRAKGQGADPPQSCLCPRDPMAEATDPHGSPPQHPQSAHSPSPC